MERESKIFSLAPKIINLPFLIVNPLKLSSTSWMPKMSVLELHCKNGRECQTNDMLYEVVRTNKGTDIKINF